jgi:hypothetical protein
LLIHKRPFTRTGEIETEIHMFSLSGGIDHEIRVKGCPDITGLDWSADGKGLYCGSMSAQGGSISRVELNGSSRLPWEYKGAGGLGMPFLAYPRLMAAFLPYGVAR